MKRLLRVLTSGLNAISEELRGDAPDIDGKIFFTSDEKLEIGQYVTVKITDTLDYDLIGEVISNESSK